MSARRTYIFIAFWQGQSNAALTLIYSRVVGNPECMVRRRFASEK
jgi:hypothetical protein